MGVKGKKLSNSLHRKHVGKKNQEFFSPSLFQSWNSSSSELQSRLSLSSCLTEVKDGRGGQKTSLEASEGSWQALPSPLQAPELRVYFYISSEGKEALKRAFPPLASQLLVIKEK